MNLRPKRRYVLAYVLRRGPVCISPLQQHPSCWSFQQLRSKYGTVSAFFFFFVSDFGVLVLCDIDPSEAQELLFFSIKIVLDQYDKSEYRLLLV